VKRRHGARRLALQGLCCLDVQGQDGEEPLFEFLQNSKEAPEVISLAREMISETFLQKSKIDKIIKSQSEHWDISRIGLVERNILRLGIWEMLASNTPVKVIINEAILLAEEFASSDSARFINGILDAVARKITSGKDDDTP